MTPHDPSDHADVWAQTIAATEYLADLARPGFTVWDALCEAIDDWCSALLEVDAERRRPVSWNDPDRLRTAVEQLICLTAPAIDGPIDGLGEALSAALSSWLVRAADEVNDGHPFATIR